eukprot:COSAG03_NODE_2592_length_2611_cov_11.720541_2_plen_46_part_00
MAQVATSLVLFRNGPGLRGIRHTERQTEREEERGRERKGEGQRGT